MRAHGIALVAVALVLGIANAAERNDSAADTKGLQAQLDVLRRTVASQQAQMSKLQRQLAEKDARIKQLEAVCKKAGVKLPAPAAPRKTAEKPGLSAKEQAYLAEAQQQRAVAIKAAEHQRWELGVQMARIVQGKVKKRSPGIVIDLQTGAYTFQSAELKGRKMRQVQERINKLNKRLAELRKNDPPFVPALRGGFAVGKVGRFEYPVAVRQIIDKGNMLVEAAVDVSPAGSGMWAVQRLNVWLSGVSTENLVDDVGIELESPFEITGTRQYRPPAGPARTVFVASPFDASRVNRAMRRGK